MGEATALLTATIRIDHNRCPFRSINGGEEATISVAPGQCVWLKGESGIGKSSIAYALLGLPHVGGLTVEAEWNPDVPNRERIGMLFQDSVLLDELTVEGNLRLSCSLAGREGNIDATIDDLLDRVRLRSPGVRRLTPSKLSGGMRHRVALAQALAQRKRLVILDEPFTGLDDETADDVIELLRELRRDGMAFLIISHRDQYVGQLIDDTEREASTFVLGDPAPPEQRFHLDLLGVGSRTAHRLVVWLILAGLVVSVCLFAVGIATGTVFAEFLDRVDIEQVSLDFPDWIPERAREWVRRKIAEWMTTEGPRIRRRVFAVGMANAFAVEIGPLLSALLLAGLIGGWHAGDVAMMRATGQANLLRVLGRRPWAWWLPPAVVAGLLTAPVVTLAGTFTALVAGGLFVGVRPSLFREWRHYYLAVKEALWRFDDPLTDPLWVNLYRSIVFMVIILVCSEVAGRVWGADKRHVRFRIMAAVVVSCILIVLADWQLALFWLDRVMEKAGL